MVQVLFVQGGGEHTHDDWDSKLVASLESALGPGYTVHYPRMPDEADPQAAAWKTAIDRALESLEGPLVLVGHSIGAAILLDHVAARPERRVAGVFLIAAPFIGEGGWPSDELRPTSELAGRWAEGSLFLYHGTADDVVPVAHLDLFAKVFPHAVVRRLQGRDHQLDNDLSEVAHDLCRSLPATAAGAGATLEACAGTGASRPR